MVSSRGWGRGSSSLRTHLRMRFKASVRHELVEANKSKLWKREKLPDGITVCGLVGDFNGNAPTSLSTSYQLKYRHRP